MTSGVQPTRFLFTLSYFPVCYTMVTDLPRRSGLGRSPCVGSEICADFRACYTMLPELRPPSPTYPVAQALMSLPQVCRHTFGGPRWYSFSIVTLWWLSYHAARLRTRRADLRRAASWMVGLIERLFSLGH